MPRGPDVKKTNESRCLNCGCRLNALGTGDHSVPADPHPGDITVCIKCGAVMMLDENLLPRGMNQEEMDQLIADRETMDAIAHLVRHVYLMRAQRG